MQESLQGIRMKIKIANPDYTHPLLHYWKDTGRAHSPAKPAVSRSEDQKTATQAQPQPSIAKVKVEVRSPIRKELISSVSKGKNYKCFEPKVQSSQKAFCLMLFTKNLEAMLA